jgi:AsmA protein
MKTWIKRILIGFVVVVVVAVVGLAIFLLTFDPNAYKYKLVELVKDRYQRTLTIDGDIQLSLFPRLGLSLQDVALSEANSTETFASIESARLAVAIVPLLSNHLVVDHIAIAGFKARLVREKAGNFNFDNLVGETNVGEQLPVVNDPQALVAAGVQGGIGLASQRRDPTRFQIDIAGLELQNGKILLQDQTTGQAVAVNNLNANTGRVTFSQPFNVTISAHIGGGNPRVDAQLNGSGMLTLDPAGGRYAAQRLDLRVVGQLPDVQAKTLAMRGNMAFNGMERSLDVSALEVLFNGDISAPNSPLNGVEASLAIPKLALYSNKRQLQLERLTVRAAGSTATGKFELAVESPSLNISPEQAVGQAITGRLRLIGANSLDVVVALAGISGNAAEIDINEAKLEATSKTDERLIKTSFVSPLTANLLTRVFTLSGLRGDVAIMDSGLPKGSLQIPVIGSVSADLVRAQAQANINAVLEGGKFDLSAEVSRPNETTLVGFNLNVDILDLDKLVPPATPVPSIQKDGVAKEGKPSQTLAPAKGDGTINLSGLVGPSASGTIKVGRLVMRGLVAEGVSAAVKLNHGKLDLTDLVATLYEGKLSGGISIDAAQNNRIATKLSLAGIAIEPLLTDIAGRSTLMGKGSMVLDLHSTGANTYALSAGLGGTVQARLRDGAIKGINIAQTLRQLKQVLAGKGTVPAGTTESALQTDFTSFDLDLAFQNGIGTIRDLKIASPLLRITQGKPASINLVNHTLDMVTLVRVVATPTGQNGAELADLRQLLIPIHFAGPISKPLYSLEWQGLAEQAAKYGLQNKLRDALRGKGSEHDAVLRGAGKALKGLIK